MKFSLMAAGILLLAFCLWPFWVRISWQLEIIFLCFLLNSLFRKQEARSQWPDAGSQRPEASGNILSKVAS
jgi:hypothetical protein